MSNPGVFFLYPNDQTDRRIILFPLLSLSERIPRLTVEIVQMLSLDKVDLCGFKFSEQFNNIGVFYRRAIFRHIAAAPVIGTERLRETVGPDFDPAIGNHQELERV